MKSSKRFPYKEVIYKWIIYIAAVALVVSFMPSDGKFNYQFEVGKPWKYGQLMATFDFPIYKSEKVIKKNKTASVPCSNLTFKEMLKWKRMN